MLDLIVNPYAGRGRAKTDAKKVFEILDANNVKFAPHYTARKKHATEIAYNLTLSGAETIVSVGGDGTIHEIVNGIILARRELEKQGKPFVTRLALIPAGTGNDFMRSANLPLSLEDATKRILSGTAKPVDAIEIDGTYEICFACRGIDVDVVNMVNASKKKTSSSYLKKILLCIFKGIKYDFCINIDGNEIKTTGIVAAVLNGAVLAGGMHFCSPAKIDDGLLDVIVVEKRNRAEFDKSYFVISVKKLLVNRVNRPFVVRRLHADDYVDFAAALIDHTDIHAGFCKRGEQPCGGTGAVAHSLTDGCDQRHSAVDFNRIGVNSLADS